MKQQSRYKAQILKRKNKRRHETESVSIVISQEGVSHKIIASRAPTGVKIPALFATETESERKKTQREFDRIFESVLLERTKA